MATTVRKSAVKIWFGMLKLAMRQGVPINEEFYRPWGTRQELEKLRLIRGGIYAARNFSKRHCRRCRW